MEAVIFDMDGVIIDSEPMHVAVEKDTFKQLGIEVSDEEMNQYIGVTNTQMWREIKDNHGLKQSVEKLVEDSINAKLVAFDTMSSEPIDGILEAIKYFKSKGYLLAVGSSSPMVHIEAVLHKLSIREYFEALVSAEEVPNSKPAPDVFLEAAKQLGVPPNKCAVIEDSSHGIDAANAAGMVSIGYRNPHNTMQSYDKANYVVDDINEIVGKKLI